MSCVYVHSVYYSIFRHLCEFFVCLFCSKPLCYGMTWSVVLPSQSVFANSWKRRAATFSSSLIVSSSAGNRRPLCGRMSCIRCSRPRSVVVPRWSCRNTYLPSHSLCSIRFMLIWYSCATRAIFIVGDGEGDGDDMQNQCELLEHCVTQENGRGMV